MPVLGFMPSGHCVDELIFSPFQKSAACCRNSGIWRRSRTLAGHAIPRYNVCESTEISVLNRLVYCGEYLGADGGLLVTGGCPGGRPAGAEFPPILKFLSASETIGFDASCPAPAGDCLESSEG